MNLVTNNNPERASRSGFALIASLSIMAVLVMIGVALFSISSVATKSADIAKARTEAQANARMALMLAIGDLQKYTGADTRITAPADILDEDAPKVVGAWKSWEGLNHNSTGRPIRPDYSLKNVTNLSSGARFLTWLVSGNLDSDGNLRSPLEIISEQPAPDGSTVPLLADGSLSTQDSRHIHLSPSSIDEGNFAWWVSPENQKMRVKQPYSPRSDDPSGWMELGQSHTSPNLEIFFGVETSLDELEPFSPDPANGGLISKTPNRQSIALIDDQGTDPEKKFHDISTNAAGLLTNTATGGWRKDLSILTEKWDEIYDSYAGGELPLFRFRPIDGATSQVPKPTASNYDPLQSSLYPWSEYSTIIGEEQPNTHHAASASWQSLQSFATAYKGFTYDEGELTSPFVWDRISDQSSNLGGQEFYNFHHQQRLYTQIARFQFLIYGRAFEKPKRNPDDPDEEPKYEIRGKFVPVFTLWNPYNISLELTVSGTEGAGQGSGQHTNFRGFGWRRSLPGAMAVARIAADGTVGTINYKMLTPGNFQTLDRSQNNVNKKDHELEGNMIKFGGKQVWRGAASDAWGCWLPEGTLTFGPGEAKIISPDFIDVGYGFGGGSAMRMKEGFDPTELSGPEFQIHDNQSIDQRYRFLFRPDRLTQPYLDRPPGAGFSLSFGDGASHFGGTATVPSGIGDEFHNITALANEDQANDYWPPDEVDEIDYSVGELVGRWTPLFSISFGPRMTIGTGSGTEQNRPTKGTVQNDGRAAMVLSDPGSGLAKDHPVNNTFDFAYHSTPANSTITPDLSESQGYIATGYKVGDGLSRLIMIEMPLRPMASLLELQGWNPRGNNPYPPFQMNLIGNSDATPLIPADNIVPGTLAPNSLEQNLMHDDAYCANHLLFDDWFVSSIAPRPTNLGSSVDEDIETVYEDFLQGNSRLSNRAYKPIEKDRGLDASEASSLADEILNGRNGDGWLKVASRFEVEGMFNVNSTSIEAWEALLGHAKSREEIAQYGESSIESTIPSDDHAVTRGAAAFDEEAGSGSVIGADGTFTIANEYLGFRSLDDAQIRDLAEKIVRQIRLRGPFLSLAEFVNRQLSEDADLALAGAIQTAINNLSNDPMSTLRDPNNDLSAKTMSDEDTEVANPDTKLDGAGYEFTRAAEGDSAYGAPGWIRQADILRPIAPILSARDDTFTIRAYGDKLDRNGNVIARAWCEAVVKRSRNFCDASDPADSIEPPTSPTNAAFGRKYEIVSFRWLPPEEV